MEDLEKWTQNKMKGFKRAGPTEAATRKTDSKPSPPVMKKSSPAAGSSPSVENSANKSSGNANQVKENADRGSRRILYCHYFSNFGKCNFEQRTGATCKFEHKGAPMCQNGTACQRTKCMYKHPNVGGIRPTNPFLEQNKSHSQSFNPWQFQMMNPWLNQNQNQFPNPWNVEMNRN